MEALELVGVRKRPVVGWTTWWRVDEKRNKGKGGERGVKREKREGKKKMNVSGENPEFIAHQDFLKKFSILIPKSYNHLKVVSI